jgi:uncharacterized OB-fold protein
MSLVECVACRRRYATVPAVCRQCGRDAVRPSPVRGETALAEAVTAVRAGIPEEQAPLHLVVAQLAGVAVLARAETAVGIGDRLVVDDAPDGGFVARAEAS